jgi:hypothetical protein
VTLNIMFGGVGLVGGGRIGGREDGRVAASLQLESELELELNDVHDTRASKYYY